MKATAKNGDVWTGEKESRDWFIYKDTQGNLYSSREQPCYRIEMNNSRQITVNGRRCIAPITD